MSKSKPSLNTGFYIDSSCIEEILNRTKNILENFEFESLTPTNFRNAMRVEKIRLMLQPLEDAISTLKKEQT